MFNSKTTLILLAIGITISYFYWKNYNKGKAQVKDNLTGKCYDSNGREVSCSTF